jgi:hypothetical protein
VSVPILGWIKSSARVYDSVNRRAPLMLQTTASEEGDTFRAIADALLVEDVAVAEGEDVIILDGEAEPEIETSTLDPEGPRVMDLPGLEPSVPPPPTPSIPTPTVPARIMPTVYVRPPRGTRPEKAKKKSPDDGRRVRRVTLPGMTPVRVRATPGPRSR